MWVRRICEWIADIKDGRADRSERSGPNMRRNVGSGWSVGGGPTAEVAVTNDDLDIVAIAVVVDSDATTKILNVGKQIGIEIWR